MRLGAFTDAAGFFKTLPPFRKTLIARLELLFGCARPIAKEISMCKQLLLGLADTCRSWMLCGTLTGNGNT